LSGRSFRGSGFVVGPEAVRTAAGDEEVNERHTLTHPASSGAKVPAFSGA